ncbi:methionyl-tRNA formyltransferase [Trueperella sp. LYQ143]|uniref:methionyl-tRNA formyltransferase n=1 Tax=unclassified Trueperella TaxID=2630174 RepID=UPI0039836BD8
MRILFAGTPQTAVPSLQRLHAEHEVLAVLTRAPAPVGRKRIITPSAVHICAEELGLPVLTPRSLRDPEIRQAIIDYAPQAVAVVAYGLMIPAELLHIPTHGWINLHFSLLPRWRGAAPVQHSIAAGDSESGTCVFQIEEGLDTGPIYDCRRTAIEAHHSADTLLAELAISGAIQLSDVLGDIEGQRAHLRAQTGEISYAPRITSADTRISWQADAAHIEARIRGWTSAPGAWTMLNNRRVKIGPVSLTTEAGIAPGHVVERDGNILVGTATTALRLGDVAPAGKSVMAATQWWRGLRSDHLIFDEAEENTGE